MKSGDKEQSKRHAFDSYCKKILKNEARDHYAQVKRRRQNELSFSELSQKQLGELYVTDTYFNDEQVINVLDLDVVVNDMEIANALRELPKNRSNIILLSYFLELSDREIGERLNMIRATVQYQRKKALHQLREILIKEGLADEEKN